MYNFPKIHYPTDTNLGFLYNALKDVFEFKDNLKKEDLFNKDFWKEALKQKHFMPILAELLFGNFDELKKFLKENFEEEITKKVKEEIERDLEILSSDIVEINKTSSIYTRNLIFYFFEEYDEKKAFKELGLDRFYTEGIFEKLVNKPLNNLNLFLLAALVGREFNKDYFSDDCKRVFGCLFALSNFYEYDKAEEIFADKVLYKMLIQDVDEFYYVLDSNGSFYISKYMELSQKVKEFIENNKIDLIRLFFEYRYNVPMEIIESCEEIEEALDEDEINEVIENEGFESFEEMCEEMGME
jgi:hypothetical protein